MTSHELLSSKTSDSIPLPHAGRKASIKLEHIESSLPWSPKSLYRAKSAIVYKETLNDTLLVMKTSWNLFFPKWKSSFISLQDDFLLIFSYREAWEQGLEPDQVRFFHFEIKY